MSTHLGLSYSDRLGNSVHYTSIFNLFYPDFFGGVGTWLYNINNMGFRMHLLCPPADIKTPTSPPKKVVFWVSKLDLMVRNRFWISKIVLNIP